jgi:hypothetical protein
MMRECSSVSSWILALTSHYIWNHNRSLTNIILDSVLRQYGSDILPVALEHLWCRWTGHFSCPFIYSARPSCPTGSGCCSGQGKSVENHHLIHKIEPVKRNNLALVFHPGNASKCPTNKRLTDIKRHQLILQHQHESRTWLSSEWNTDHGSVKEWLAK